VRVYPPSTLRSAPVMYLEASLSRKVTAPMRSSGVPILPTGIREVHLRSSSGFSSRILRVLSEIISVSPLIQLRVSI